MRVYLDVCCLCRPFDDQSIGRNRLESEAVLAILEYASAKRWTVVAGPAVHVELRRIADEEKRDHVTALLAVTEQVELTADMETRARRLHQMGFTPLDALHLAAAEAAKCDVMLTTDVRMIRRGKRFSTDMRVGVMNPLDWILEQF